MSVGLEDHVGRVQLMYNVDGERDAITIDYPAAVALSESERSVLAAAAGAYVGSLFLAEEVAIDVPLPPGLAEAFQPLVDMLFDIRCWKDAVPLLDKPQLVSPVEGAVEQSQTTVDTRRALVPWSGGKDSTLALLTLEANGYAAEPVHVVANAGAEQAEQLATARLAARLGRPAPATVRIAHPRFIELTRRYAIEWDQFPIWNRVPFGRDLLLGAVLAPYSRHLGSGLLSFGHDNECRNATVHYEGRKFARNDLESAEGAQILAQIFGRFVHPQLTLLPPVGNLSELRILRDMFVLHPELMGDASFCFWGRACGRCAKCLRYSLADRVYGRGTLAFEVNPLSRGACPELDDVLDPAPRSTLFQEEVLVLLSRVAGSERRTDDDDVLDFAADRLGAIAGKVDEWERELLAVRSDPQVPADLTPYWELQRRSGGSWGGPAS